MTKKQIVYFGDWAKQKLKAGTVSGPEEDFLRDYLRDIHLTWWHPINAEHVKSVLLQKRACQEAISAGVSCYKQYAKETGHGEEA